MTQQGLVTRPPMRINSCKGTTSANMLFDLWFLTFASSKASAICTSGALIAEQIPMAQSLLESPAQHAAGLPQSAMSLTRCVQQRTAAEIPQRGLSHLPGSFQICQAAWGPWAALSSARTGVASSCAVAPSCLGSQDLTTALAGLRSCLPAVCCQG